MQQAMVTINGYVGGEPVAFGKEGGAAACSFRLGCTRSYYDAKAGAWKEGVTTWGTVKAFRTLASNILQSVHKGDPVMVCGALQTEQWTQDGAERSRLVIEAQTVGHDLTRGIGMFQRQRREGTGGQPAANAQGGVHRDASEMGDRAQSAGDSSAEDSDFDTAEEALDNTSLSTADSV